MAVILVAAHMFARALFVLVAGFVTAKHGVRGQAYGIGDGDNL